MPYTRFHDMNSGGGQKEDFKYVFIEASQEEAELIFYNRFDHNPNRVSCTCCGPDYSIDEKEDLAQASGFERGCELVWLASDGTERTEADWMKLSLPDRREMNKTHKQMYVERPATRPLLYRKYAPLDKWLADNRETVLIISADEILESERQGELPEQGYVWKE